MRARHRNIAMTKSDEQTMLNQQIRDLRDEGDELDALLQDLAPADWGRITAFRNWTVYDVVAHLHLSDHMGMTALQGETPFRALMRDMAAARRPMSEYARSWLGAVDGPDLRQRWRALQSDLCAGLAAADPEQRLPWAGPGMRPRMFATARQMETWAHGWEIYDLLGVPRRHGDRLKNVATIGVRTFGWTFANRQLPVPGAPPYVALNAPSGAVWEWHDPASADRVTGDAVEFCQVVTQVRHVRDTRLEVCGAVAEQWMSLAQCFAGPPVDPPAPGSRVPRGQPADAPGQPADRLTTLGALC
jgi:uncharacterized protein (TIGR03084 family)